MASKVSGLVAVVRQLAEQTRALAFAPPVAHVYRPLDYARRPHESYLERYGAGPKTVVLVGMNPGPWGMVQTGVPFGDVRQVRDWLGIEAAVGQPAAPHPKRPVLGFACGRREVSGSRLWGWARSRCPDPARFFASYFVLNYCPLAFVEDSGRNRTPDKLPAAERKALVAACDEALRRSVALLAPAHVVGVGAYALAAARRALPAADAKLSSVLHPSPASPRANRGWAEQAEQQLVAAGVPLP